MTSPRVEPTSPRSPDSNPWKALPSPTPDVKPAKTVSFTEIIQDETKQKESLQKVANKPLHLIQVRRKLLGYSFLFTVYLSPCKTELDVNEISFYLLSLFVVFSTADKPFS